MVNGSWLSLTLAMAIGGAAEGLPVWDSQPQLRATIRQRPRGISLSLGTEGMDGEGNLKLPFDGDNASRIASLEKQLQNDDSDVPRLCELSQLYEVEEKSSAAAKKALAIAQRQLERNPEDLNSLLQLCVAHRTSGEVLEAEKLLREAVKKNPRSADVWTALGRSMHHKAVVKAATPVINAPERSIVAALPQGKSQIAVGNNELYDEADRCFHRAIELDPLSSKAYFARAEGRQFRAYHTQLLRSTASDNVELVLVSKYDAACIKDLNKAAELAPLDARLTYAAAIVELTFHIKRIRPEPVTAAQQLELKKLITPALDRLDRLSRQPDRNDAATAAFLHAALTTAWLWTTDSRTILDSRDYHGIRSTLKRAIELRPDWVEPWNFLEKSYWVNQEIKEALEVAQARLQRFDDASSHFSVGQIYCDLNLLGLAKRHIQAAREKAPNNAEYELGYAAYLLKTSDDAEAFERASKQLNRAEILLGGADEKYQADAAVHVKFLRGVHAALGGDPLTARLLLTSVLRSCDHQGAERATKIIGD